MKAVLGLAVAVALVAGCSGGGAKKSASAPVKEIGVQDFNPVPRDQLAEGGTLRWPLGQFPEQFNVHHVNGGLDVQADVVNAVLPSAFTIDEKGVATPDRNYVLDAQIKAGAKPVVTLALNPKATWSDGKAITADDYISYWKAMNGQEKGYETGGPDPYDQMEKVAQGKDEHEVLVTFRQPYADWRKMFSTFLPASTSKDPDQFNKGWVGKIPVSAGPFKLDNIDATAKTITLVRNPDWWGNPAKLDKIIYRTLEGEAQVNSFVNGEVDFVNAGDTTNHYQRIKGMKGISIRRASSPNSRFLMLNGSGGPMADVRVRQAIMVGLNRQLFAQAALKGMDWPVRTLDNHFYAVGQEGYQDTSGELGKYDAKKAAQLLDQAGWVLPAGKQVREKGGQQLKLRFHVIAGVELHKTTAELTQALLKDLGIKVEILTAPQAEFFDEYVRPGNFDLVTFGVGLTAFPSDQAGSYQQPTKNAKGEVLTRGNEGRIGTPELDAMLKKMAAEMDPVKARQLANEADTEVWKQVIRIMLYQQPEIIATKPNLANYGATAFSTIHYEDIGFTK